MQILPLRLLNPQTGSTFESSTDFLYPVSAKIPTSNRPEDTSTRRYPFLATLLSPTNSTSTMDSVDASNNLQYTNNITRTEGIFLGEDLKALKTQYPHSVTISAEMEKSSSATNRNKESDKRAQKRKRGLSDLQNSTELNDVMIHENGQQFEHSHIPYLIVNMYERERNGYTFALYLPETSEKEATLFRESHLIPYSESYLTDCIDAETFPDRLLSNLDFEKRFHSDEKGNSVLCEIRDFRHCSGVNTVDRPRLRHVVLKQTTETILADFQRVVLKGHLDLAFYKNAPDLPNGNLARDFENERVASKRMRLSNSNYSYNRSENTKDFRLDADEEDKHELTLDQRLELEKRIVKETSTGLCLDPSKHVGLLANYAQYEKLKWNSKELKQSFRIYSRKNRKFEKPERLIMSEGGTEIETQHESEKENERGIGQGIEGEAEERNVNPPSVANLVFQESRRSFHRGSTPLLKFINKCIHSNKLKRPIDKSQPLKLLPTKYMDYGHAPALTSFEEIRALSQPADSASIRPLFSENFVTKTEEYIFETERRKHPHRTVVTIYQRNGGDNYFGELEQEALEEPCPTESNRVPIKPYVLDPPTTQSSGSKCQFDLGSSQSVHLYVKQFTDIFTEDGRRPCKITFQKAGQPGPTVLCTSSYKNQQMTGSNNNTAPTSNIQNVSTTAATAVHVGANVIIARSGAPTPPHTTNTIIVSLPSGTATASSTAATISIPVVSASIVQPILNSTALNSLPVVPTSTSSSASPSPSNPPVQIVHPQPRLQPNIQMSTASQLYAAGIQALTTSYNTNSPVVSISSPSTQANVNPSRIVQQHQLLTRPKIFNVNLTSQQQPHFTITRPTALQQASQLIHALPQSHSQQNVRVKQLGVTRLVLSTAGIPHSSAKPITVIQPLPQPQNHTVTHSGNQINVSQVQAIQLNNTIDSAQHHHHISHPTQASQLQIASHTRGTNPTNNPIMIMLASPATGNSITDQNSINISSSTSCQNTLASQGGNVSLNLSAINLDGLLAVSNSSLSSLQQHPQAYVTSTALVNHSTSIPNAPILNAVEVSNATAGLNTVNIVRYSNNTGTITVQPQVIRQNSISTMIPQQQTAILGMNSSSTSGVILNKTQNATATGVEKHIRFQQNIAPQLQQLPPELEDISGPDLNTLLSNSCSPNRPFCRATAKVPSIDVNVNLNLNLSGTSAVSATAHPISEVFTNERQNGPSLVNVSSVDSIFNALSDAIGPDLDDNLNTSTGKLGSRINVSMANLQQKNSVMTLNGLLGSPPMSTSNIVANHSVTSPMQSSPQSPSISSILSPISPNVVTSTVAFTTPRLSALLAGTPSADSSHGLLVETVNSRNGTGSGNCSNLFDRLLSQGQTVALPVQRTGGSRLNPIATATPSVALEHPVLAATLTQGTNPNLRHALTRPTTYRQIAPAPPPNLQNSTQQQQLINNLLGMIGTTPGNQTLQQQAIRINKPNHTSGSGSGPR